MSNTQEYNPECGLSKEEWEIEKIVDQVRLLPTIEAVGILRKWKTPPLPAEFNSWIEQEAEKWKSRLKEESGIYGYEYEEKLDWIQENVVKPLQSQLQEADIENQSWRKESKIWAEETGRQLSEKDKEIGNLKANLEGTTEIARARGEGITRLQDRVEFLEEENKRLRDQIK